MQGGKLNVLDGLLYTLTRSEGPFNELTRMTDLNVYHPVTSTMIIDDLNPSILTPSLIETTPLSVRLCLFNFKLVTLLAGVTFYFI